MAVEFPTLYTKGNPDCITFFKESEASRIMKATGIVRRIDDLGRVVIPKEIRRTLRIREGDPLEIFVDRDGEVILKKYSPIGELGDFAKEYAESLFESTNHITMISDRDNIIAVAGGSKKDYLEKPVGPLVETCMESRKASMETSTALMKFVKTPRILTVLTSSPRSLRVAIRSDRSSYLPKTRM